MCRLIVLAFFFVAAVSATPPPSASNIVEKINTRMQELYNAGEYALMLKELYKDDAYMECDDKGRIAEGQAGILARLHKGGIVKKIEAGNIVEVPSNNGLIAQITVDVLSKDGQKIHYQFEELIEDEKIAYLKTEKCHF